LIINVPSSGGFELDLILGYLEIFGIFGERTATNNKWHPHCEEMAAALDWLGFMICFLKEFPLIPLCLEFRNDRR
jgi:hypothetical protein